MGLSLAEFQLAAKPRRLRCGMAVLLEALDDKDRAVVVQALADESINANAISRTLAANGHKASHQTVQRHRRGQCSCAG